MTYALKIQLMKKFPFHFKMALTARWSMPILFGHIRYSEYLIDLTVDRHYMRADYAIIILFGFAFDDCIYF